MIEVTGSSQGLSLHEVCRSDAEFEPFQSGFGMHEAVPASEALWIPAFVSIRCCSSFAVMGTSLRHLEACKSFGMMRLEDTSCRYVAALRTGLESRKRVGKPDSCPMLTMLIVTCLLETLGLFRVRLDARCFTMTERLRRVNRTGIDGCVCGVDGINARVRCPQLAQGGMVALRLT